MSAIGMYHQPLHASLGRTLDQPLQQEWPHSDPCRGKSFSFPRFLLMATLFLCMTVGSLPLFFLLMKRAYGVQAASAIAYTIFAVFFTFATYWNQRGKRPATVHVHLSRRS